MVVQPPRLPPQKNGEGGKKVIPASAGTKPGARIFVRSTSFCGHVAVQRKTARRAVATAKTSSQKEE
jgi:hypothetical protein